MLSQRWVAAREQAPPWPGALPGTGQRRERFPDQVSLRATGCGGNPGERLLEVVGKIDGGLIHKDMVPPMATPTGAWLIGDG